MVLVKNSEQDHQNLPAVYKMLFFELITEQNYLKIQNRIWRRSIFHV